MNRFKGRAGFSWGLAVALAGAAGWADAPGIAPAPAVAPVKAAVLATWGAEALAQIQKDLSQPGSALYAEEGKTDGSRGNGEYGKYSFVWPAALQLRALAAAAEVQPAKYLRMMTALADGLDEYWIKRDGLGGYAVLPKGSERYYDDNAYVALAVLDVYEASKQRKYLLRAAETFAFVASSEKKTAGGGLRQHETKDGPIAVCATAPAVVAALRLHKHTKDRKYLVMAERWHAVLMSEAAGVRDAGDGLFHEHKEGKRAYLSAHVLQACLLFHEQTKDKKHLEEAQRIAASAVKQWIQPDGSMKETGQWGGDDLTDAWLALYEVDKDARWLAAAHNLLKFQHEKGRDKKGRHGEQWNEDRSGQALEKFKLLYMAPAARAYWRAAGVKVATP